MDDEGNPLKELKPYTTVTKDGYVTNKKEVFVVKPLEEYKSDKDGHYGVPRCYVEQATLYNEFNITEDVSTAHNWNLDAWTEYLGTTYFEHDVEMHFCLIYTFKDFQKMYRENKPIDLYKNPRNPYKSWSTFIREFNKHSIIWNKKERTTEYYFADEEDDHNWKDDRDNVMDIRETSATDRQFSSYLDFQGFLFKVTKKEDPRILGNITDIHRQIIKEMPSTLEDFIELNTKKTFDEWLNKKYPTEFVLKRRNRSISFKDLHDYVKLSFTKDEEKEVNLHTYLGNPRVAYEWKTIIIPKATSIGNKVTFSNYLENRDELYSFYHENYYRILTKDGRATVEYMRKLKSEGWKQVSNSGQTTTATFSSLLEVLVTSYNPAPPPAYPVGLNLNLIDIGFSLSYPS